MTLFLTKYPFLVLTTLTTLLFLIYQTSAQTPRPQNLCRDATEAGSIFAADPSDCRLYLFCDESGTFTLSCELANSAFPFFNFDRCIDTSGHCMPLTTLCPPQGELDIMVEFNYTKLRNKISKMFSFLDCCCW